MKTPRLGIVLALVLLSSASPTFAQDPMAPPVGAPPAPGPAGATNGTVAGPMTPPGPEANPAGTPAAQAKPLPTELDLPEDSSIKLKIEPLMVNNLVDRVAEPCTITVECPQALSAEVFIVPVDAPYGGRALARPRLLGRDNKPSDGLTVRWADKESDQYVKIFAVVRKRSQPDVRVRSHTVDLAMYGVRFKPNPAPGPNPNAVPVAPTGVQMPPNSRP